MTFATFSLAVTPVPVPGGTINGYQVMSVIHSGRKVPLSRGHYYYIPYTNTLVAYRGSRAKPMKLDRNGKYKLREKFADRLGAWSFAVDATPFHESAIGFFKGGK
jgi:hypothetical protein